jgi:2-polyprenyl-6-methoxyphenol hydroxylase-like FAD-dependent oxidoreductase
MESQSVQRSRRKTSAVDYDGVIVGGGPAGAVMAWALAREGARVVVLDRARFPREKVCGDFIEPRGLRLFRAMGCLPALEKRQPLPISHVSIFLNARRAYHGSIPFYGQTHDLPPHGYIVPRLQLDMLLLEAARTAGAEFLEGCSATNVSIDKSGVTITTSSEGRSGRLRARFVVGADQL